MTLKLSAKKIYWFLKGVWLHTWQAPSSKWYVVPTKKLSPQMKRSPYVNIDRIINKANNLICSRRLTTDLASLVLAGGGEVFTVQRPSVGFRLYNSIVIYIMSHIQFCTALNVQWLVYLHRNASIICKIKKNFDRWYLFI